MRGFNGCFHCRKPVAEGLRFCSPECDFKFKLKSTNQGECWEWRGKLSPAGYGQHRKAYELFKGPIPEGLWVLHTCDNKKCCNPDHLYAGTRHDNIRDAVERKRYGSTSLRNQHKRNREILTKHFDWDTLPAYAKKNGG